ncbi:MAG: Ig domain-containing protein, partial [Planctomycetota bacterium]|nr:Ig domain-containing protein [Planctomycetota bacterium]
MQKQTSLLPQSLCFVLAAACGSAIDDSNAQQRTGGGTSGPGTPTIGSPTFGQPVNPPSNLTYSDPAPVYHEDSQITPNAPSYSGVVQGFAVQPALPSGLHLDTATGIISGTPLASQATSDYTVFAHNLAGYTTTVLAITVIQGPPTDLAYMDESPLYYLSEQIPDNTPTWQGTVDVFAITPPLPAGLHLDGISGVISGTPSALHPTSLHQVTAFGPTGHDSVVMDITVVHAPPTGLSYTDESPYYQVGQQIPDNTPTWEGAVDAFAITPPLPAGLLLDGVTGVISGTPSAPHATTSHQVTAIGPGGQDTVVLAITVFQDSGSLVDHPDGSGQFVLDPHQDGQASELRFGSAGSASPPLYRGRLVDIFDVNGDLLHEDFVIGEDIRSDSVDYLLETNLADQARLSILHPGGTQAYLDAFFRLEDNLIPVYDQDLAGSLFSMCPRNGALVMRCDDLLDGTTVTLDNIKLFQGYPPESPFLFRLIADRNHGGLADFDGDGNQEFHTTRVIIDPTISMLEAYEASQPLPPNALGFDAGRSTHEANLALRIPTLTTILQPTVLANLAGNPMALTGNGSTDPATSEVLRALRSGGPYDLTGDYHNGFLEDVEAPQLVGVQPINVSAVGSDPSSQHPLDFVLNLDFNATLCARTPRIGDVIEWYSVLHPGYLAEVIADGPAPSQGTLTMVRVRLILGEPQDFQNNGT